MCSAGVRIITIKSGRLLDNLVDFVCVMLSSINLISCIKGKCQLALGALAQYSPVKINLHTVGNSS